MDNSNFLEKLYIKVSKILIDNDIITNNINEEYALRISYFDQLLFSTIFYSLISKNNNSMFVRIPLLIPKRIIANNCELDSVYCKDEDQINSIPLFRLEFYESSYKKNKSLDEIKELLNVVSTFFNGCSLYDCLMSLDDFNNNLETLPIQNLSSFKNLNFQEIIDVFSLFTNDEHRLIIVSLHKNELSNNLFNEKYVEIELKKCEEILNLCLKNTYDQKEFHVLINEYFEKVKKIKLMLNEIHNHESKSFFNTMHKVNGTASATYRYNPYSKINGKPLFNNVKFEKALSNNITNLNALEEVKYSDVDIKEKVIEKFYLEPTEDIPITITKTPISSYMNFNTTGSKLKLKNK